MPTRALAKMQAVCFIRLQCLYEYFKNLLIECHTYNYNVSCLISNYNNFDIKKKQKHTKSYII